MQQSQRRAQGQEELGFLPRHPASPAVPAPSPSFGERVPGPAAVVVQGVPVLQAVVLVALLADHLHHLLLLAAGLQALVGEDLRAAVAALRGAAPRCPVFGVYGARLPLGAALRGFVRVHQRFGPHGKRLLRARNSPRSPAKPHGSTRAASTARRAAAQSSRTHPALPPAPCSPRELPQPRIHPTKPSGFPPCAGAARGRPCSGGRCARPPARRASRRASRAPACCRAGTRGPERPAGGARKASGARSFGRGGGPRPAGSPQRGAGHSTQSPLRVSLRSTGGGGGGEMKDAPPLFLRSPFCRRRCRRAGRRRRGRCRRSAGRRRT